MKYLFLPILILFLFANPVFAQNYTIKRVIDGDILELANGETVRLIGLDCPENEYSPEEAAYLNVGKKWERSLRDVKQAKEATEFVKEEITLGVEEKSGRRVRLEFDVQKKDKYGRLLAYAYLVCPTALLDTYKAFGDKDPIQKGIKGSLYYEIFLNARIIQAGYASPLTVPPNVKYTEVFEELYQEAKKEARGLWKVEIPCTMVAKVCPDGTTVGRVPPNCEFAKCPE